MEQVRDPLVLGLTLVFAPFFVFLYSLFFPSGSTVYKILVVDHDAGARGADGSHLAAGQEAVAAIKGVTYADGSPLLWVKSLDDPAEAEPLLRDREAAAFVIIPEDFSGTLLAVRAGDRSAATAIRFGGDLTNPYYAVAAILATSAVDSYVQQATGQRPPVQFVEEPMGASAARTEFEIYVPGIFVFAVILLVFTASMTVAREVEARTLRRLALTRMTAFDLLGGISAALIVVGVVGVVLTLLTAAALGFRSQGPLWVAVLVGALTSLSIIGVALVVACFSRSVAHRQLPAGAVYVLLRGHLPHPARVPLHPGRADAGPVRRPAPHPRRGRAQ